MVTEDMLAFIAHNFFVQDQPLAKFKASNWDHLDEDKKNLYIYKAMDAISKWKQSGMSIEKIHSKLLVKEDPEYNFVLPDDELNPHQVRLGTRMNDAGSNNAQLPNSRFDDEPPF